MNYQNDERDMEEIIRLLTQKKKTISVMESCTGGALSNMITNVPGSSMVFNFGAVTYSNEYKIKLGVNKEIIDKYSVYSMETAREMSNKIVKYTSSDYGIGITGKLLKSDPNNLMGEDNVVYISIYVSSEDKYYEDRVIVTEEDRFTNKKIVLNRVIEMLLKILK